MKSELIVDVQPTEVSIALLEDGRLMSLQKEARNIAYAVGDIYLAKVKKLMPGLNAAFVNVGYEKDAFLHYLDLGAHFATYSKFVETLLTDKTHHVPQLSKMKILPDIDKHGSVVDTLQPGRELLVQIVKEPISSKGPRLTTEITFTGRYMVLIPFSDKISISQKIKTTEEKVRLRQLISSIKPKNYGVIIRTSAEGKRVAELNNELKTLIKCWEDACAKAQNSTAPALVFEEESRIVGMLRDVFSPSFEAIYVNDPDVFQSISNYVSLIAPDRKDIVRLYNKPEPIFDTFSVTRQIKSSFGKTVSFKSGAYIIIEHTEALHVIDVNSGNRTKATNDQETNALEVNLRAADEIARQLRLRDMGGIIVVDFIDMSKNEHRQQLYEHMKEVMANDRARHNILPLSKFGLMQITRQRVRPALDVTVTETCPSCYGHGVVQPSLLFTDVLYEKLDYVITQLGLKNFRLYVHPYVEAYLKKGWLLSEYARWKRRLGGKFKIYADQSLAYLQYKFIDAEGNEVDVKQEKDTNSSTLEKTANKARKRGTDEQAESDAHVAKAAAKQNAAKAARAEKTIKEAKPKKQAPVQPQEQNQDQKQDAGTAQEPKKQPRKAPTRQKQQGKTSVEVPIKVAPVQQEGTEINSDETPLSASEEVQPENATVRKSRSSRARARAKARAAKAAAEAAAESGEDVVMTAAPAKEDNEPVEKTAPVTGPVIAASAQMEVMANVGSAQMPDDSSDRQVRTKENPVAVIDNVISLPAKTEGRTEKGRTEKRSTEKDNTAPLALTDGQREITE